MCKRRHAGARQLQESGSSGLPQSCASNGGAACRLWGRSSRSTMRRCPVSRRSSAPCRRRPKSSRTPRAPCSTRSARRPRRSTMPVPPVPSPTSGCCPAHRLRHICAIPLVAVDTSVTRVATARAGLLALLGWMDAYRSTLVGLGLPDDAIHISTVPRVKTPRGEAVPMHGVDVARLVYIDRIRRQLGKAFSNLAESDLLQARAAALLLCDEFRAGCAGIARALRALAGRYFCLLAALMRGGIRGGCQSPDSRSQRVNLVRSKEPNKIGGTQFSARTGARARRRGAPVDTRRHRDVPLPHAAGGARGERARRRGRAQRGLCRAAGHAEVRPSAFRAALHTTPLWHDPRRARAATRASC